MNILCWRSYVGLFFYEKRIFCYREYLKMVLRGLKKAGSVGHEGKYVGKHGSSVGHLILGCTQFNFNRKLLVSFFLP